MTIDTIGCLDSNLLSEAISGNGNRNQLIVAIEELSELQKELTKCLRGQSDKISVSEEMADVIIMLHQLGIIFGNDSLVNTFIEEKQERLRHRLNGDCYVDAQKC